MTEYNLYDLEITDEQLITDWLNQVELTVPVDSGPVEWDEKRHIGETHYRYDPEANHLRQKFYAKWWVIIWGLIAAFALIGLAVYQELPLVWRVMGFSFIFLSMICFGEVLATYLPHPEQDEKQIEDWEANDESIGQLLWIFQPQFTWHGIGLALVSIVGIFAGPLAVAGTLDLPRLGCLVLLSFPSAYLFLSEPLNIEQAYIFHTATVRLLPVVGAIGVYIYFPLVLLLVSGLLDWWFMLLEIIWPGQPLTIPLLTSLLLAVGLILALRDVLSPITGSFQMIVNASEESVNPQLVVLQRAGCVLTAVSGILLIFLSIGTITGYMSHSIAFASSLVLIASGLAQAFGKLKVHLVKVRALRSGMNTGSHLSLTDGEITALERPIQHIAYPVNPAGHQPIILLDSVITEVFDEDQLRSIYFHEVGHIEHRNWAQYVSSIPFMGFSLMLALGGLRAIYREEFLADKYAAKQENIDTVMDTIIEARECPIRSPEMTAPETPVETIDSVATPPLYNICRPSRDARIRRLKQMKESEETSLD